MKTIATALEGTKSARLSIADMGSAARTNVAGPAGAARVCSSREASGGASSPRKTIRVLLADDHPIVRKGLSSCLAQVPQVEIIAEATDGQEALRKAKELSPDIVLMDID